MTLTDAAVWRNLTRVEPRQWLLRALFVPLVLFASGSWAVDSDPAHRSAESTRPRAWPDGIIPFDTSKLSAEQKETVEQAMQRWMDTEAGIAFVPRTDQDSYVYFTGRTDAGNNTSQTGFKAGHRPEINITAFWWRQGEWMPAHELGHVLGFHHEHARWDRDAYVVIHYENIKEGRQADYDWIARTNWITDATSYDYRSIMHYRVCWTSSCESRCHDGDGSSPCAVIDPIGTNFDRVIGQWGDNQISALDAERARAVYGADRTVYVKSGSVKGDGTLLQPFASLADARRATSANCRFIILAADGSFSIGH
jgi:hypothetical protein